MRDAQANNTLYLDFNCYEQVELQRTVNCILKYHLRILPRVSRDKIEMSVKLSIVYADSCESEICARHRSIH